MLCDAAALERPFTIPFHSTRTSRRALEERKTWRERIRLTVNPSPFGTYCRNGVKNSSLGAALFNRTIGAYLVSKWKMRKHIEGAPSRLGLVEGWNTCKQVDTNPITPSEEHYKPKLS